MKHADCVHDMKRIYEHRNVVRVMDLAEGLFGIYDPEIKGRSITKSNVSNIHTHVFRHVSDGSENMDIVRLVTHMGKTF